MRTKGAAGLIVVSLLAAGCSDGGTSTREVEQAAIERARKEFRLAADVPLEAQVWAAEGESGEVIACGTISGAGGGAPIRPQRFAATTDPIRWLVFEDAHKPLLDTGEDRVPDWVNLCDMGRQS